MLSMWKNDRLASMIFLNAMDHIVEQLVDFVPHVTTGRRAGK